MRFKLFRSNTQAAFDAVQILGADTAALFDSVADETFMAQALSTVTPKQIKQDTVALVGSPDCWSEFP